MKVPFNDLYLQHSSIKDELDLAINDVIKKSSFVRGEAVENFENDFAKTIGVKNCVSCANGTDALYIAMKCLNLRPGEEVIVPANSWISSSETVTQAGGTVVFSDVNSKTNNIDIDDVRKKINKNTVGIIPVHLYGYPADMEAIMNIAKEHNLWVIEDCAQAHLASINGKNIGTYGIAATFSFYPGKNLGAMGDAGAVISNNDELAKKMAMYSRHGGLTKGSHKIEGINSRLDGIQAAVLSVKLKYLSEWTEQRRGIAEIYSKKLEGLKIPIIEDGYKHVFHLYVVQHEKRDALKTYLESEGISSIINYPCALPFLEAYKRFGHSHKDFPVSYHNQSRILSLPLFPGMKREFIDYTIEKVNNFVRKN
jgi:dTDP-4-amino-4,6-dideoxygalactose transaminase